MLNGFTFCMVDGEEDRYTITETKVVIMLYSNVVLNRFCLEYHYIMSTFLLTCKSIFSAPDILPCNDSLGVMCYVVVQEIVDRGTAEESCKKNYGGHLVSVNSEEEKDLITHLIHRDLSAYSG